MFSIPTLVPPPFRHRATVERDTATGRDGWNSPKAPAFEVLEADQPCDYWVADEDLITGPNVNAAVERARMLIPKGADVAIGDEVSDVRNESGITISAGRLKVVGDLPMEPTHRELRFELASSPRAREGS